MIEHIEKIRESFQRYHNVSRLYEKKLIEMLECRLYESKMIDGLSRDEVIREAESFKSVFDKVYYAHKDFLVSLTDNVSKISCEFKKFNDNCDKFEKLMK